jgi:hypothetical protein
MATTVPEVSILQNEPINEQISAYISKEEILKCIQKLKNEKACGEDEITNASGDVTSLAPPPQMRLELSPYTTIIAK